MAKSNNDSIAEQLAILGLIGFTVKETGFQTLKTAQHRRSLSSRTLPVKFTLGALSMCNFIIESTGLVCPEDSARRQAQPKSLPPVAPAPAIDHVPPSVSLPASNGVGNGFQKPPISLQLGRSRQSGPSEPVGHLLYGSVFRTHGNHLLHALFQQPLAMEAYAEFAADALESHAHDPSKWKTFEMLDAQVAVARDLLDRLVAPKRASRNQDISSFLYRSQLRFVALLCFAIRKWGSGRNADSWAAVLTDDKVCQAAWQISIWLRAVHEWKDSDEYCKDYYRRFANARNQTVPTKEQLNSKGFRIDVPTFDAFHHSLMASWGLASGHQGTCLLLSDTWSESPSAIADRFEVILELSGARNITSGTLAKWSHAGDLDFGATEVDNKRWHPYHTMRASANGLFRPKIQSDEEPLDYSIESSHLCHEHLCVLHSIHEPKRINLDRKGCYTHVRRCRQDGEYIAAHCNGNKTKHDPPCKLQLACLTREERLCIQSNLLRQVRGLASKRMDPPQDFPYDKFFCTAEEASLALVRPGEENTITTNLIPYDREAGARPMKSAEESMQCLICLHSYSVVGHYFRHVVREHGGGVGTSRRAAALEELRRGAFEWQSKGNIANRKANKATRLTEYLARNDVSYEGFIRYYNFITTECTSLATQESHYSRVMGGPNYEFLQSQSSDDWPDEHTPGH